MEYVAHHWQAPQALIVAGAACLSHPHAGTYLGRQQKVPLATWFLALTRRPSQDRNLLTSSEASSRVKLRDGMVCFRKPRSPLQAMKERDGRLCPQRNGCSDECLPWRRTPLWWQAVRWNRRTKGWPVVAAVRLSMRRATPD